MTAGGRIPPAEVAVIVPVGGAAPGWGRCAQSLERLDPAPGALVVVIDGPRPDLAERAARLKARVLSLEERGGPARARNRGAEAASQRVLLFLDADVEVPPDLVARVAGLFSASPDLDAAFGSYDDDPAEPGLVSRYRNLLHHFVHQHSREEASTFWAGCGAVREGPFRAVGGFDESYREPSVEDIELGARLVRGGHRIRLVKDLQVKHLKRWTFAGTLSTDLWRRAVPWTELMLGDSRLVNDLNVRTLDRISVALAGVAAAAIPAALLWPPLLAASPAALLLVVGLNARLFGFFLRRRGPLFALASIPLYWAYLLTCGAGFALGVLRYALGGARGSRAAGRRVRDGAGPGLPEA